MLHIPAKDEKERKNERERKREREREREKERDKQTKIKKRKHERIGRQAAKLYERGYQYIFTYLPRNVIDNKCVTLQYCHIFLQGIREKEREEEKGETDIKREGEREKRERGLSNRERNHNRRIPENVNIYTYMETYLTIHAYYLHNCHIFLQGTSERGKRERET